MSLEQYTAEEMWQEMVRRKLAEAREWNKDPERVRRFLQSGGSVTTKFPIDTQKMCREIRGKE